MFKRFKLADSYLDAGFTAAQVKDIQRTGTLFLIRHSLLVDFWACFVLVLLCFRWPWRVLCDAADYT